MERMTAPREQRSRLQRRWLRCYGIAVGVNGFFTVYALVALLLGALEFEAFAFAAVAAAAVIGGAVMARRLARAGVTDLWFIKGTTTTRIITAGWMLIGIGFVLTAVAVLAGVDLRVLDSSSGIFGAIGAVALLAVIGPGYSEYRESLQSVTVEPPSAEPSASVREPQPGTDRQPLPDAPLPDGLVTHEQPASQPRAEPQPEPPSSAGPQLRQPPPLPPVG